jgi:hypothetical protein
MKALTRSKCAPAWFSIFACTSLRDLDTVILSLKASTQSASWLSEKERLATAQGILWDASRNAINAGWFRNRFNGLPREQNAFVSLKA